MKRDMHYATKSLKELLECYSDETQRINRKETELAKALIVNEVYARIKNTFDWLDDGAGAEGVYRQLIEH